MRNRHWLSVVAVGMIVAVLTGCRDKDPPPTFYRNLGTDNVPLLPVTPVVHDVTLAKGSADWIPFRELDQDATDTAPEESILSADSRAEIEEEIRGLLEDYNGLVAERDIEELLVYHIESHQETVKSWYETQFALLDQLSEVQTAIEKALPDSQARIAKAFAPLKNGSGGLSVDTLTVENDNLVVGKLAGGGIAPICRFVVSEDEWFIDLPNLRETFTQLKPVLEAQMSTIDTLKKDLQSGQVAAEQVLAQFEAQAKALSAVSGPTPSTEGDDGDASSNEESNDKNDDDSSPTDSD